MSRIFISHSSRDNAAATALRDWMKAEGWDEVFLDLDPQRGIVAGERWERALHEAASRCEAVVFLVSRNWLASQWCDREYALARGLNKTLLAVLVDPALALAKGRASEAREALDKGRAIISRLVSRFPDQAQWKQEFVWFDEWLGAVGK